MKKIDAPEPILFFCNARCMRMHIDIHAVAVSAAFTSHKPRVSVG